MTITGSNYFTSSDSEKNNTAETTKDIKSKNNLSKVNKLTNSGVPDLKVVEVTDSKLPSYLQVNKNGIEIPIMCSIDSSSVKLDEISKVSVEKDADSCFYDIFVSSTSYPYSISNFNKDKTIEDYQKQNLPLSHLGVVEERFDNGVLSFDADDKTKQYLDEFMCSCKIDYGALRELFISMSSK